MLANFNFEAHAEYLAAAPHPQMEQSTEEIGPYKLNRWLCLGKTAYGHDKETLEHVYIKTEKASALIEWEVSTLQKLSGGIGIPSLRWSGTVDGQKVIVTDGFGPFLEELFDRCSRFFGVYTLALLADQMLSRLEWMHSRHISHGNLSPSSFAVGNMSWQMPQLILADLGNANISNLSSKRDLEAVGNIIFYLSSGSKSWEDFRTQNGMGQTLSDPLRSYFAAISESKLRPTDYGRLRQIFRNTCQTSSTIALINDLIIPQANRPNLKCLATASTGDLFEVLGSKLSAVGGKASHLMTPWKYEHGAYLLRCLNDILAVYTVLLIRDRPSRTRKLYLVGAYHLPNRLWRDLRWYISAARNGSTAFQEAIILNIYKFMGLMLEMVPCYDAYWTSYLLDLTCILIDLRLNPSEAWESVRIYWRGRAEALGEKNVL
ncbi:hypothetical protein N7510_011603 [Penicillium lagena]|uniref:uncharacterized protein n=1 Tax=Penicillium lagena TaxID=94218 RepID=UPI0025419F39|nr:uncharacterized protein N7510_011603 [Penicillium lagena]KAJ5602069.1 hypothetical protein N7510_011603 [Penicillium lagena]